MKSPLWLSRIRRGFILQGTDNNRLYSGNHVTIISKISLHTGDRLAGLEKISFLTPTPNPASLTHTTLTSLLSSFICVTCRSHTVPRLPKPKEIESPESCAKAVVERSAWQCQASAPVSDKAGFAHGCHAAGTQSHRCGSHTGALAGRHTQLQLPLAARSTPA